MIWYVMSSGVPGGSFPTASRRLHDGHRETEKATERCVKTRRKGRGSVFLVHAGSLADRLSSTEGASRSSRRRSSTRVTVRRPEPGDSRLRRFEHDAGGVAAVEHDAHTIAGT